VPEKSSEQAFFENQKLPPEKRGVTFEALFYKQLHNVTARIHDTENLEQIMLEASQDICKLLNADRLTLYAVNEDRTAIVSKVKTGLNSSRDLKLPISPQSLAGYAAFSRQQLNLADVYDDEALKQIHPALTFLKEVDKRSGYRTRQMLVAPILDGDVLHGVLQIINNKSDQAFGALEVEGVAQLCKTLATAIRQRMQRAAEASKRKATKFDGLVADGVISSAELEQCVTDARTEGKSVEHMLMANFKVRPAQIGPSLSKFFGVPYEPFNAGRIRPRPCTGRSSASSSRRRRQRARQAGQQDHHRRLSPGRLRHPHRAPPGQGEDPDPLPQGRLAGALHRGAGELPQSARHPHQDHVRPRHLRAPQAAGRQDQVPQVRPARHRAARGHAAHPGRHGRRGDAPPRQQRADPARQAGPAALQPRAAQGRDRQALRHLLRVRPDRLGQDHHAALHPQVHQHARHQDLDGRGPGRNHPEGPAPGAGQPQGRASTSPP
jgi:hypothetical protein